MQVVELPSLSVSASAVGVLSVDHLHRLVDNCDTVVVEDDVEVSVIVGTYVGGGTVAASIVTVCDVVLDHSATRPLVPSRPAATTRALRRSVVIRSRTVIGYTTLALIVRDG